MTKRTSLRILSLSASIVCQLLFALYITPRFSILTQGNTFLDIAPIWDPQVIVEYIAGLSIEAKQAYASMQIVDLFYPIAYTGALLAFAPKERKIKIPIFLGLICDYSENLMIHSMLNRGAGDLIPRILPYCTAIKFSMIGMSIGLIIIYALRRR